MRINILIKTRLGYPKIAPIAFYIQGPYILLRFI
nr:MAG TPA: hypothetical protein [Caudoviricetes sp.]